jgi:Domain of unknown function (DUF4126)
MRSSSPRPRGFLGPSSTVTARETLAKGGLSGGARPRLDVRLFLDITQGMGLAGAAGVRPFLPALLSGALARADLGLDFEHTRYAFLESTWFLIAVVVLLIITVVIERRRPGAAESGAYGAALGGVAVGIGALLFAGSLADNGETSWAWLAPGIACALLGQAAARSLFGRVAKRLDAEARLALPLYADGGSLAAAGLAVLIPPVSILILIFFGWLWIGGRRRADEKYEGLRSLTK